MAEPAQTAAHRPVVLFDADCGFCTWALERILRRDRAGAGDRVEAVAIQSERGAELLAPLPAAQRLDSWHVIDERGRLYSGGAAAPVLLERLSGGRPAARVLRRFPRLTDRGYRFVADHRRALGRLFRVGGRTGGDGPSPS